jgi:hypothetical protein
MRYAAFCSVESIKLTISSSDHTWSARPAAITRRAFQRCLLAREVVVHVVNGDGVQVILQLL